MGTSTAHRSPERDERWEAVRGLIRRGAPAAETASAIARAVPDSALEAFAANPALARVCVAGLDLEAGDPYAEAWAGAESRHTEILRIAALRAALRAGGADPVEGARLLAAETVAAWFEHLVARDVEAEVGSDAVPDVAAMNDLIEAVGDEGRRAALGASGIPMHDPRELCVALVTAAFVALRGRGRGR